jgi:hypothetical protein
MYAYINSEELKSINKIRPELQTKSDLQKELQAEYVNAWLYAGDETIVKFQHFLENPNEETFASTVLLMRKELWNKKSKLEAKEFKIY